MIRSNEKVIGIVWAVIKRLVTHVSYDWIAFWHAEKLLYTEKSGTATASACMCTTNGYPNSYSNNQVDEPLLALAAS
jgi:hypothetical protein